MIQITKMSRPKRYRRNGREGFKIDACPKKDTYIPLAIEKANLEHPDPRRVGYVQDWNQCYLAEMDRLLSEAGLRLL